VKCFVKVMFPNDCSHKEANPRRRSKLEAAFGQMRCVAKCQLDSNDGVSNAAGTNKHLAMPSCFATLC